MKKFLKQFLGYTVITICGISAAFWTLFDIVILAGLIVGKSTASGETIFAAITTLPLLAYFWWAWVQPNSVNKIDKLIH